MATANIVPAPFTKLVILGIQTALETNHDLNRLQYGLPVEIYKSEEEWMFEIPDSDSESIGALVDALTGSNPNKDKYIQTIRV